MAAVAVVTATTTTSGWRATLPPGSSTTYGDDGQEANVTTTPTKTIADVVLDDDELFELDIALLDGRDDDHYHHRTACRYTTTAGAADDDDAEDGHALLANCLLPLRAVSNAVPVAAASGGRLSSVYPYSGYYSSYSSRRLFTPRSSRRFLFLGRSAGNSSGGSSARLCFSSRGFEAMGNYFQRY